LSCSQIPRNSMVLRFRNQFLIKSSVLSEFCTGNIRYTDVVSRIVCIDRYIPFKHLDFCRHIISTSSYFSFPAPRYFSLLAAIKKNALPVFPVQRLAVISHSPTPSATPQHKRSLKLPQQHPPVKESHHSPRRHWVQPRPPASAPWRRGFALIWRAHDSFFRQTS
jgi:hypothetical protein